MTCDVDAVTKKIHADAQLVEKRTMDSRIMGRPGVYLSHLACHEQMGGALNGEVTVKYVCVGGWSVLERGCGLGEGCGGVWRDMCST